MGIVGNDLADKLSKGTAELNTETQICLPYTNHYKTLKKDCKSKTNNLVVKGLCKGVALSFKNYYNL